MLGRLPLLRIGLVCLATAAFGIAAVAAGGSRGEPDPAGAAGPAGARQGAPAPPEPGRAAEGEPPVSRDVRPEGPDEEFPESPGLPPPGHAREYLPIGPGADPDAYPPVRLRDSRAVGRHAGGQLRRGVLLPREGEHFTTWDAILRGYPSRPWRRVGHDRMVRTLLEVAGKYREKDPDAPRIVVADLSLPRGGPFGPRYGSLGHASHQVGLDVDIYYPRRDGRERPARAADQIDRRRSQALIDLFLEAGASHVFVDGRGYEGPPEAVQSLAHHERHMHVRLPFGPGDRPRP